MSEKCKNFVDFVCKQMLKNTVYNTNLTKNL